MPSLTKTYPPTLGRLFTLSSPPKRKNVPEPESSDEEVSLASSIDSSGDDAEPKHFADIHKIETCKLVTGKSKKAWVHVVDPADDGLGERWKLNCNINLCRATATSGDLEKMRFTGKPFCPSCMTLCPLHIKNSITIATRTRTLRGVLSGTRGRPRQTRAIQGD